MDNLPSANRALLSYICSLLSESVAVTAESNSANSPGEKRGHSDCNADSNSYSASDRDNLGVLLIKAEEIPLAIPMDDVKEIVAAEGRSLRYSESVEGRSDALLNHDGRDIRILDLKEIILPGGHTAGCGITELKNFHVLVLDSGAYGLICDEVLGTINLNRQQVEWRSYRQSRPWLQGMVKDHNHALLDVKEIIRAFISSSKKPH